MAQGPHRDINIHRHMAGTRAHIYIHRYKHTNINTHAPTHAGARTNTHTDTRALTCTLHSHVSTLSVNPLVYFYPGRPPAHCSRL